jgi:hypothetical protein
MYSIMRTLVAVFALLLSRGFYQVAGADIAFDLDGAIQGYASPTLTPTLYKFRC